MIAELLSVGTENARTGKELAIVLSCNIRDITEQIERERREGQPICATTGGRNAGYFLAGNAEELEKYCRRLNKRAGEMQKTRRALLNVLSQYAAKMEGNEWQSKKL